MIKVCAVHKGYEQISLNRGMINTVEDFIHYSATESSFSGKAYKVRCKGEEERTSADWLNEELENYRRNPGIKI